MLTYDQRQSTQARSAVRSPSSFLMHSEQHIELLPPVAGPDKLLFQGFCNGLPIAFARVRRLRPEIECAARVVALNAASQQHTWTLHTIQVTQNYRGRGIGTALLGEILHHCRVHGITRLVGEIKGDLHALRRWYLRNGFDVSLDGRLELLLR